MFQDGKLVFDGETYHSLRHGNGIQHFDEYTYEGEFVLNTMHGIGKQTYKNGCVSTVVYCQNKKISEICNIEGKIGEFFEEQVYLSKYEKQGENCDECEQ